MTTDERADRLIGALRSYSDLMPAEWVNAAEELIRLEFGLAVLAAVDGTLDAQYMACFRHLSHKTATIAFDICSVIAERAGGGNKAVAEAIRARAALEKKSCPRS
jgi:hypothetical protein